MPIGIWVVRVRKMDSFMSCLVGLFFAQAVVSGCRNVDSTNQSASTGSSNSSTGTSGSSSIVETKVQKPASVFGIGRFVPQMPDCWEFPRDEEKRHVNIDVGTVVLVDARSRTDATKSANSTVSSSGQNSYFMYKVVGPSELLKKLPVVRSKVTFSSSSNDASQIPEERLSSCWIEEKYLDRELLRKNFTASEMKANKTVGLIESKVNTYFKVRPESADSLLAPKPQRDEAVLNELVTSLKSEFHDPAAACMLPLGSQILFNFLERDSAGKLIVQAGHVRVSFEPHTRIGSETMGIEFGAPYEGAKGPAIYDKPYYDDAGFYGKHWKSLKQLYPMHRSLQPDSVKTGLSCSFSNGWVFKDHFKILEGSW